MLEKAKVDIQEFENFCLFGTLNFWQYNGIKKENHICVKKENVKCKMP